MNKADTRAITNLKREGRRAAMAAIKALRVRAEDVLSKEVPKGKSGKLGRGVKHEDDFSGPVLQSKMIVTAINKNAGGSAVLHMPGGKTKQLPLRGGQPFDYARAVAEGTGLYGPRGKIIVPKTAKVLLIGVENVPAGEAYIQKAGQKYILRPRSKGMKADPYPERAGATMEREAPGIVSSTLAKEGLAE